MSLYAKNNKQTADTWVGQEIQPNTYYQIAATEQTAWGQNDKVIADLGSTDLVLALDNSGTTDISSAAIALNYLRKETPVDSDGAPITKQKIVPEGWAYQLRGFDIELGQLNGLTSLDAFGVAKTDVEIKHYDAQDVEITQQIDMVNAVKSVLVFEPPTDYAIVGGIVYQDVDPASDIRLGVVAAPYVPKAYGGSVEFGAGINLKHVGHTGSVSMDGRNPKILTYDATNHTSMLHVNLKYAATTTHTFHLLFELFQPPGA